MMVYTLCIMKTAEFEGFLSTNNGIAVRQKLETRFLSRKNSIQIFLATTAGRARANLQLRNLLDGRYLMKKLHQDRKSVG